MPSTKPFTMDERITPCRARPGHTEFKRNRTVLPVIVSAKRFNGIMDRALMMKKRNKQEADEEENRYMQYLKEGSKVLRSYFTNMESLTMEEERQIRRDQEILEDQIRRREGKLEDERSRKERIMRAHRLLENLKPGHIALKKAMLQSDMAYQRKFNEALNREIALDAERQQKQDELLCPEVLIPYRTLTEEQEKAIKEKKRKELLEYYLQERKVRHEQRMTLKEQEDVDVIIERAQYQCLDDLEKKGVREKKKADQEFRRRDYQESLKEKAKKAEYERRCEFIDDRKICVNKVCARNLKTRVDQIVKKKRVDIIEKRAALATRLGCQLRREARKLEANQEKVEEHYEFVQQVDEEQRKCELERKRKDRMAYERENHLQLEEERKRQAQIERFEIAKRFKNIETNKRFNVQAERKKEREKSILKKTLFSQRDEFIERRDAALVQDSACDVDINLQDDMEFFEEAVNVISRARATCRPMFPIAKAVNQYRTQNQIDFLPEGRRVTRNKLRDCCWPGFYSKANVAYRKYKQRDECRDKQNLKYHELFANCVKITKMAAEELAHKPCVVECPIKCIRHRGVPAINSCDSFDCSLNGRNNSLRGSL